MLISVPLCRAQCSRLFCGRLAQAQNGVQNADSRWGTYLAATLSPGTVWCPIGSTKDYSPSEVYEHRTRTVYVLMYVLMSLRLRSVRSVLRRICSPRTYVRVHA